MVGTESGDLLLFEGTGEYKTTLSQSPSNGKAIHTIASSSKVINRVVDDIVH